MNYLQRAKELEGELVSNRRNIHELAECGMQTEQTASYVEEQLRGYGICPNRIGECGVTALIGKGAPVILLRADMDALPMQELSGVEFAAKNGNCHACGHDLHTAMLLCAAKMLKENEATLNGTVKLMFQPGEEIFRGALDMVQEGILENPKVDAAMGLHGVPSYPTGHLFYAAGPLMSSCDEVHITVKGTGSHGATPWDGIDPIHVTVQIYQAIQAMLSREINSQESVSLTFGMISGGSAPNIIPEKTSLSGTLRTFNNEVRSFVQKRVRELAEGIATAFGAEAVVEYPSGVGSLTCDATVVEEVADSLKEILSDRLSESRGKINASEDFSYLSERVPSVFLGLGTGTKEDGYVYPQHNPKIIFDEQALPYGAAAYAQGAAGWLQKESEKR